MPHTATGVAPPDRLIGAHRRACVAPPDGLSGHEPLAPDPADRWIVFFNDTAPTEIYTLSLPDALPISRRSWPRSIRSGSRAERGAMALRSPFRFNRSEEHTSELQSLAYLVCRLLL